MKKRSVRLAYYLSGDELLKASQEFVFEVYKDRLGRNPQTEDNAHFNNTFSKDNSAIQDMFYDGVKYGTITTSVVLDAPGYTELMFTPL